MIQLVVGKKGKGKTKIVLDMVNKEIKNTTGNIVYLDKSIDHMYELNNKVRLINLKEYGVSSADEFIGFILGIVSQDHDLDQMYFDSFLKLANVSENGQIEKLVNKLDEISNTYHVNMVASVSMDEVELPDSLKTKIIVSL